MVEAHRFECGAADCVFLIRAASREEVVEQVRRHAVEQHDRNPPSEKHIRDRTEAVEVGS